MSTDKPSGMIAKVNENGSILDGLSDALVDDTVVLVDDAGYMVGGQSTPTKPIATKIITSVPRPTIKIAR